MNLLVIFKALVIRYLFVYKDMETIFSLHDFSLLSQLLIHVCYP